MTEFTAENLSSALAKLISGAGQSVVSVHSHKSRASGFVWRPGLIVTADEALADEGEIMVATAGGTAVSAKLAGRDPTTDVALLRVDTADLLPASFSSAVPAAGHLVVAVGARDGAVVAAHGIVSHAGAAWRSMRGGDIDQRIELDLRLSHMAEGGVAVDHSGKVLGMAVLGPRRRALVIPAATIERVAARLLSHGRIARGYLGLGLQPVHVVGAKDGGVMVISVDSSGPGATAGFHQGDILTGWNGEPIKHMGTLLRALGPDSVGTTITLDMLRAGESRQMSLVVGERPSISKEDGH